MNEPIQNSPHEPADSSTIATTKPTGWVLLATSATLVFLAIYFGLQQRFWLLPPPEKLEFVWNEDLKLLQNTRHASLLQDVREVKLRTTAHSPAQDWLPKVKAAVPTKKDGKLILDVFLIHQIEGHRYGVIMQYALLDAKTGNMVDEFARTLWLGIYY
jgi:hypothetical protein